MDMIKITPEDFGHRYGNFHNYYNFHSCSSRLDVIRGCGFLDFLLQYRFECKTGSTSAKIPPTDKEIYYCDFGCNEGDLTLEMANLILDSSGKSLSLKVCGLDADHDLIDRAQTKVRGNLDRNSMDVEFHVCNLIDDRDHLSRCKSFLQEKSTCTRPRFDLVSIFSTTMWLHIHAGDDGLRQFIERSCELSDMILIEPQPSKWYEFICMYWFLPPHKHFEDLPYKFSSYKDVNVRLRKMNRPEVDVSTKRLKLRENMGEEIERIMVQSGFQRIQEKSVCEGKTNLVKHWNRTIYLFARIR